MISLSSHVESAYLAGLDSLLKPTVESSQSAQIKEVTPISVRDSGLGTGHVIANASQEKTGIASWWTPSALSSNSSGANDSVSSRIYRSIRPQSAANKDRAAAMNKFVTEFDPNNRDNNVANAKAVIATRIKAQLLTPDKIDPSSNQSEVSSPQEEVLSDATLGNKATVMVDTIVAEMTTGMKADYTTFRSYGTTVEIIKGDRNEKIQSAREGFETAATKENEAGKAAGVSEAAAAKAGGIAGGFHAIKGAYYRWCESTAGAQKLKYQNQLTERAMTSVLRKVDIAAIGTFQKNSQALVETGRGIIAKMGGGSDGSSSLALTTFQEGALKNIPSGTTMNPLQNYHDRYKSCRDICNKAMTSIDIHAQDINSESVAVQHVSESEFVPTHAVENSCVHAACIAANVMVTKAGAAAMEALKHLADKPEDISLQQQADKALQKVDEAMKQVKTLETAANTLTSTAGEKYGNLDRAAELNSVGNTIGPAAQLIFSLAEVVIEFIG